KGVDRRRDHRDLRGIEEVRYVAAAGKDVRVRPVEVRTQKRPGTHGEIVLFVPADMAPPDDRAAMFDERPDESGRLRVVQDDEFTRSHALEQILGVSPADLPVALMLV